MITSAVSDTSTYEELSILWYKYQICKVSPLDYKFRCQWIEAINQVGRISYLGELTINIVGVLKIESTVSSSSRSSPLPLSVWPDRAFFVFIGNLFSYKSSPKIRLLFGYFEKNPFCSKTAVFRPLLEHLGYFLIQHLVTLDSSSSSSLQRLLKTFGCDYKWPILWTLYNSRLWCQRQTDSITADSTTLES